MGYGPSAQVALVRYGSGSITVKHRFGGNIMAFSYAKKQQEQQQNLK